MKFSSDWKFCVRHLAYCLWIKYPYPYPRFEEELIATTSTSDLVRSLTFENVAALLWFSAILAEEMNKIDGINALR